MRKSTTLWLAALLLFGLGLPKGAFADAHCFCSLACQDNTNFSGTPLKGWLWDSETLATYSGLNQQSEKNRINCGTLCTKKCFATWTKTNAGSLACSKGCGTGAPVACWSHVGTTAWRSGQEIGVVHVNPPVKTCTCPRGWAANTTNVDGGVTADGKCKKAACPHSGVAPMPSNGTPIGTWGFTWGDGFIAWGTSANGGAATCQTNPGTCGLQ